MNDQRKTNDQLQEELERERERSIALQDVSKKVAAAHDTDEVLDLIVNEAARLLSATGAFLRLLEEDFLVAKAATESAGGFLADSVANNPAFIAGAGIMGHVLATKKPLVVEDVQSHEMITPSGRLNVQKAGFHGTAYVPLLANGHAIGVLSVVDTRIRNFSEDEVSLLMAFADQAALALEKARLLNEAETERERSDALYRVSNLLAGAHDTDEVLDLIVNEATRLIGATGAFIRLVIGDGLVPSASTKSMDSHRAESADGHPSMKVEEGTSLLGHVMATKKPRISEDLALDELVTAVGRQRNQDHGFHGAAAIPLLANDRSIGVLGVVDSRVRRFTEDEVSLNRLC